MATFSWSIISMIILGCVLLSLLYISADLIMIDEDIKKQRISEKKALIIVFRSFLIVFLTSFVILSFLTLLVNRYFF